MTYNADNVFLGDEIVYKASVYEKRTGIVVGVYSAHVSIEGDMLDYGLFYHDIVGKVPKIKMDHVVNELLYL